MENEKKKVENYLKIEELVYNSKKTGEQKNYKKITLVMGGFEFELLPKGDIHTLSIFKQAQELFNLESGNYKKSL